MESPSFFLALTIMEEMALWQREGMSSSGGGLCSLSTSVAMSGSDLVSVAEVAWGLFSVDGSLLRLLAEFRSRVMRLICIVSDLLIGVWIL
jgi:hypothetical protein